MRIWKATRKCKQFDIGENYSQFFPIKFKGEIGWKQNTHEIISVE